MQFRPLLCRCSTMVVQRFCKPKATGSIPVSGSPRWVTGLATLLLREIKHVRFVPSESSIPAGRADGLAWGQDRSLRRTCWQFDSARDHHGPVDYWLGRQPLKL